MRLYVDFGIGPHCVSSSLKPNYFKKQGFHHNFYLPKVIIKNQNGHGILSRLVPFLKCMKLVGKVLHGHFGPVYLLRVSKNDDKTCYF